MIAISSNDIISHPQDNPHKMKEMWNSLDLSFPYLFDSNQKLVYRGRLDESSPGSDQIPSGKDLRTAIDNLQNNRPISDEQFPSMGCNIKWKS